MVLVYAFRNRSIIISQLGLRDKLCLVPTAQKDCGMKLQQLFYNVVVGMCTEVISSTCNTSVTGLRNPTLCYSHVLIYCYLLRG